MPAAMAAARPAASPPLTDTSGGQQAAPGSSTPTSPAPDPFDAPSFDVPRYVNSMFPTEASLGELDPLVSQLRHKVARVDGEILAAVRAQSSSGGRARGDLAAARATIEDLFGKIREIQRKAEQSELMVQEICRDIKKLDYAKSHLTATITALRRLSMLVNAVDQLQLSVERHEYAEAAHLLEAVQQLSSHFQSYVHIPKVAELKGRMMALEKSLQINTLREFELLGEEPPSPLLLERLRACCLVVEALGYQARDELIDSVCRREMGVYTQIFATIGDTARLERTVNRYKWLLKRLEARKDIWAIFPPSWHVPQLLCIMFCNITKTQLAEVLDLKSAELAGQVDSLLKAVEATNIFESEMARRFEGAPVDLGDPSGSEEAEAMGAPRPADDSTPASRVRARYERRARERQRATEGESPERRKEQEHATSAAVAKTNFRGSISAVFAPYLSYYLEQVERDLMGTLDRLVREEAWAPLSADLPVLRSSNELVEALKREMRDCVSRVTRGPALLDLAAVFQRVYRAYAARLVARLPKPASGSLNATAVLGTTDWHVKLSDDDIGVVCLIISTAEHCLEMIRQLARALAAKLVPPELASRVDMGEEEDEFQTVITHCLAVLLLGIETRLEGALAAMARLNWAGMEMAGDQSEYVGAFRRALLDSGARLGPAMPPNYFRFFCDKLLRSFAPRLLDAVFRCRKVSDVGCQQMRLDVEVMKGVLCDLAKAGSLDATGQQSFAADVHAQLGRAEAILKVVGSPAEGMVDTFFELLPQGSPSDFQRILDLKVLKRNEYQAILEQFNRRMGRTLVSSSGTAGTSAGTQGSLGGGSSSTLLPPRSPAPSFNLPQIARLNSGGAASQVGAKASAAAQNVAARLSGPNLTAAKASAAAAGESMRDSMRETMRAMKNKSLRFMQRDAS